MTTNAAQSTINRPNLGADKLDQDNKDFPPISRDMSNRKPRLFPRKYHNQLGRSRSSSESGGCHANDWLQGISNEE